MSDHSLPSDDSHSLYLFLQLGLVIASFLLNLGLKIIHVLKHRVLSYDLEADIDVEEHT
jgi:hypothetical protein